MANAGKPRAAQSPNIRLAQQGYVTSHTLLSAAARPAGHCQRAQRLGPFGPAIPLAPDSEKSCYSVFLSALPALVEY